MKRVPSLVEGRSSTYSTRDLTLLSFNSIHTHLHSYQHSTTTTLSPFPSPPSSPLSPPPSLSPLVNMADTATPIQASTEAPIAQAIQATPQELGHKVRPPSPRL